MGHDSEDLSHMSNGVVSVPLAWAMFGGSTFILFLLCYFCQKKLQDEENGPALGTRTYDTSSTQVYVIPASNRQLQVPPTHPPMPSPPPDYGSVAKKEIPVFRFDGEPPSYETAVCFNSPELSRRNDPVKVNIEECPIQKNS